MLCNVLLVSAILQCESATSIHMYQPRAVGCGGVREEGNIYIFIFPVLGVPCSTGLFPGCGSCAWLPSGMWDLSSRTRDQT